MFSKDLEHTIGQCYKRAREARHEFMTVEHLLLALLDNPSAQAVLKACGADAERLRQELEQAIEASVSRLAEDDGRDTQPTLGFQRVLQRAVYHVQSSGKKEVTGANVLVAIFGEKDSHAVYYLNQQDVTRLDVVNYLSHGIAKLGEEGEQPSSSSEGEGRIERRGGRAEGRCPDRVRQQPQRTGPGRPSIRWSAVPTRSSAPSRSCAAAARTTRCTWARPAWARPRLPRAWPAASSRARCPTCWPTR
jgi:ATP-dependent Clp protease ATP-binding subunit ClpA